MQFKTPVFLANIFKKPKTVELTIYLKYVFSGKKQYPSLKELMKKEVCGQKQNKYFPGFGV